MDDKNVALHEVLPELLSTQLLAADVYTNFYAHAHGDEQILWNVMLGEELAHIRLISMLMEEADLLPEIAIPLPSIHAFRELCNKAVDVGVHSAFERTIWALRIEHAEIDFGLESLASSTLSRVPDAPVCPLTMNDHYLRLIRWARRYEAAREVAIQIARLEEHMPSETREENA